MRARERSLLPYTSVVLKLCPGLRAGASQQLKDLDEDLRKFPRQLTAISHKTHSTAREAYVDLRLTVEHLLASIGVLEPLLLGRMADVYAIYCVEARASRGLTRTRPKRAPIPVVSTIRGLPGLAGEARNALRDFVASRRTLYALTTHTTRQSAEAEWRALLSAAATLARLQLLCISVLDVLLRELLFRAHPEAV